jgi:hypothetical protein
VLFCVLFVWPGLFQNFCVVLYIVCFVLFYVLFVCKCVLYYCHRVETQLQLKNILYHIIFSCDAVSSAEVIYSAVDCVYD